MKITQIMQLLLFINVVAWHTASSDPFLKKYFLKWKDAARSWTSTNRSSVHVVPRVTSSTTTWVPRENKNNSNSNAANPRIQVTSTIIRNDTSPRRALNGTTEASTLNLGKPLSAQTRTNEPSPPGGAHAVAAAFALDDERPFPIDGARRKSTPPGRAHNTPVAAAFALDDERPFPIDGARRKSTPPGRAHDTPVAAAFALDDERPFPIDGRRKKPTPPGRAHDTPVAAAFALDDERPFPIDGARRKSTPPGRAHDTPVAAAFALDDDRPFPIDGARRKSTSPGRAHDTPVTATSALDDASSFPFQRDSKEPTARGHTYDSSSTPASVLEAQESSPVEGGKNGFTSSETAFPLVSRRRVYVTSVDIEPYSFANKNQKSLPPGKPDQTSYSPRSVDLTTTATAFNSNPSTSQDGVVSDKSLHVSENINHQTSPFTSTALTPIEKTNTNVGPVGSTSPTWDSVNGKSMTLQSDDSVSDRWSPVPCAEDQKGQESIVIITEQLEDHNYEQANKIILKAFKDGANRTSGISAYAARRLPMGSNGTYQSPLNDDHFVLLDLDLSRASLNQIMRQIDDGNSLVKKRTVGRINTIIDTEDYGVNISAIEARAGYILGIFPNVNIGLGRPVVKFNGVLVDAIYIKDDLFYGDVPEYQFDYCRVQFKDPQTRQIGNLIFIRPYIGSTVDDLLDKIDKANPANLTGKKQLMELRFPKLNFTRTTKSNVVLNGCKIKRVINKVSMEFKQEIDTNYEKPSCQTAVMTFQITGPFILITTETRPGGNPRIHYIVRYSTHSVVDENDGCEKSCKNCKT